MYRQREVQYLDMFIDMLLKSLILLLVGNSIHCTEQCLCNEYVQIILLEHYQHEFEVCQQNSNWIKIVKVFRFQGKKQTFSKPGSLMELCTCTYGVSPYLPVLAKALRQHYPADYIVEFRRRVFELSPNL